MKIIKNIFFKVSIIILVFLQMSCDSGGGSGGSASSGSPPSNGAIKPTSDETADDDFDGVKNIDDCAPLDSSKSVLLYPDADGDGFGLDTAPICSSAFRLGYSDNNLDCLDTDPNFKRWSFRDSDGDSYGDPAVKICADSRLSIPSGYVDNNFDINDISSSQNLLVPNFKDADGDGYGTNEIVGYSISTSPAPGSSVNSSDCDDGNATNYRIATIYRDADGDGYGSGAPITQCIGASLPAGYVTFGGDCNDSNGSVYLNQYIDADGDGFGAGASVACVNSTPQAGKSFSNTDCNDSDANKKVSWSVYNDADGDGQGYGPAQSICGGFSIPTGKVNNNLDCDDSNNQKKSFAVYYDFDSDGYGSGEVQNICTNAIASPYVANNLDCNPNDGKLWKEIYLSRDDDGDYKGNFESTKKICAGRSLNLNLVSDNTDFFKNDLARRIKASSISGINGKTNLVLTPSSLQTMYTDGSGNKLSVSQTGIGNYCDPATGACTDYTNFCVQGTNRCLVITKRSSSNVLIWQKLIKVNMSESLEIRVFKLSASGEFIIGGNLRGTVDFDPNVGVINYSSIPAGTYYNNMFLLKISTNGNYVDHKVNSQWSVMTDSIFNSAGDLLVTGFTSGSYNFGSTVSPTGWTNFIGFLQDDLTFSNIKLSQLIGSYFLNSTNQYLTMSKPGQYSSMSLVVLDNNLNYVSEMPVNTGCTASCKTTQNTRGKIFTILNGTSYEFEPATGVIEVKNSQPLFADFVMYTSTEQIVFAGLLYRNCSAGSMTCVNPTTTHDWTGLDGQTGYIIVGNKNYFWKNSVQSISDLVSADGQTFILKGNIPKLSGGRISYLYSATTTAQSTASAFNVNTGFMWSIVP